MVKLSGFSWPLHPYQILTWILIIWNSILPGSILPIKISPAKYLILPLSFYLITILVIIFGYLLTKSNSYQSQSVDPIRLNRQIISYYCCICKMFVPKTSKHCGMCKRCIEGFDHHCKWLNICIGIRNYRLFAKLLVLVLVYLCILIIYQAISIQNCELFEIVIISIDLTKNIVGFIAVGLLGIFHCYLKIKGIGTYDYSIKYRKRTSKVKIEETNENENEKNAEKNLDILISNQIILDEKKHISDNLNLN